MSQLVSEAELRELGLDKIMNIFQGINPLICGNFTESTWNATVATFNKAIAPLEERACASLRSTFSALNGQPSQMLREFHKYLELIKRDSVAKKLSTEREVLISQLNLKVKQTQSELREYILLARVMV